MVTNGEDETSPCRPVDILDFPRQVSANSSGSLSKAQGKGLYHHTVDKSKSFEACGHGLGNGHDKHHEKPHSILTAFASAIINFLLMFGLCCAYGLIMFEDDWNAQHRGLAVKMNLSTALIVGLLLAFMSKIKVAIGGPDLNPVVFLGMFTGTISEELQKQHGLTFTDSGDRRLTENLDADGALLKDETGLVFCTGQHYAVECENYHAELRATTIFAVAVSSALLGIIFWTLGRFKLTRVVTYMPANIMEAFLSCVGFKVFKYALKFCKYEPKQFIPAACVGVPLYFVKSLHIGNPAFVIPLMLLLPLVVFYVIIFSSGGDIESARRDGWMFGEIENAEFWTVWEVILASSGNIGSDINFKAWAKTLGVLPIMIVVCLLDCLLKLSSTESKLPVKADKDYEIAVYGLGNLLTTLCGSSVGYMQLKFNVINYGVMGNVTDRKGGILYALFCGACFFYTTDLFNYLPRFFLSTLLFFAGSGFVAENLWGSRKYLSTAEWLQILLILVVFIIANSLLYAVIVGGLLTAAFFVWRYAKIAIIQGQPLRGGEVMRKERKPAFLQSCIRYMSSHCLLVVRLKGFIFFASAQKLISWMNQYLTSDKAEEVAEYKRVRWVIFDCEYLDGFDSSASKGIGKLAKQAKDMNVHLIWTGMSTEFRQSLEKCGTIVCEGDWFNTLDEAVQYTDTILEECVFRVQKRWLELHPMFELAHKLSCEQDKFDPFANVLPRDMERFGCPWLYCGRLDVTAYETLIWEPDQSNSDLFLVHSGRIGVFSDVPTDGKKDSWTTPIAVYTHGCFLNQQALLKGPTRDYAVALEDGQLLFWNELQWSKMSRERPYMAAAIMKAALRQEQVDAALLEKGKKPQAKSCDQAEFTVAAPKEKIQAAHEIRHRMQGVSIAQSLDKLGFFDSVPPGEEHALPTLPEYVSNDIDIAFNTYAVESISNGHSVQQAHIPVSKVDDALRYAGIFNVVLNPLQKDVLTRAEFRTLCSHGLLVPLSNSMVEKLHGFFDQHTQTLDIDTWPLRGAVDRLALIVLLKDLFKHNIPLDDVDGIANMWGSNLAHGIDSSAFVAVVARFLRMHIYDLYVLRAIQDLMGQAEVKDGDKISKEMILKVQPNLTSEQAEEMIWCLDLDDAQSDGKTLDFRMVVAILRCATGKPSDLPLQPSDFIADSPAQDLDSRESGWLRSAVLNFQIPESWTRSAKNESEEDEYCERFSEISVEKPMDIPDTCQAKLNILLNEPNSSTAANIISVVMGIMILISVFTLFLEPLVSPKNESTETEKEVWLGFECFFTAVFTIEYLMSFAVCNALGNQTHRAFLKDPMRVADLFAVLPLYIDLAVGASAEEFRFFKIARLIRISRLIRLGRLASRSHTFAPIAMILCVIWFIYMKTHL